MDVDKDGFIAFTDLHRTFHNLLGIDLTDAQLDIMLNRMELMMHEGKGGDTITTASASSSLCYNERHGNGDDNQSILSSPSSSPLKSSYPSDLLHIGDSVCGGSNTMGRVRYRDFKRYVLQTADASSRYTPSEIDYSATMDLMYVEDNGDDEQHQLRRSNQSQESNAFSLNTHTTSSTATSSKRHAPIKNKTSIQLSIVPPPNAVTMELRTALRRLLEQHSKKALGRGSAMAETTLFLEMDVDRSGYISPTEFQELIASWGLVLTDEQVRIILGKHYPTPEQKKEGIDLKEFMKFIEEMGDTRGGLNVMPWELMDTESETKRLIAKERVDTLYSQRELEHVQQQKELEKHKKRDDNKTNGPLALLLSEKVYGKYGSVLQAFTKYNQDGQDQDEHPHQRGKLSLWELHHMMKHLGLDVSEHRVLELLQQFDSDEDGYLSKGDFVRLIASGKNQEEEQDQVGTAAKGGAKGIQGRTSRSVAASTPPLHASSPWDKSNQLSSSSPQRKTATVDDMPSKQKTPPSSKEKKEQDVPIPFTTNSTMSQNTASHILSRSSSITTVSTALESSKEEEKDDDKEEERQQQDETNTLILQFRSAMENRTTRKAFDMMDVDRSKYLTLDQLKRGFKKLGIVISDDQAKQVMHRFDPENTDQMRYYQFVKLLSSNLDSRS